MTTVIRTVCAHDCPDMCSILAHVDEGRLVRVEGDPDQPFTAGFVCAKVRREPELVHSPDRVRTPLRRTGPKGAGEFRPVSWDEALDLLVERWQAIRREDGPLGILGYCYSAHQGQFNRWVPMALFHALGTTRLQPGTICDTCADVAWEMTCGPVGGRRSGVDDRLRPDRLLERRPRHDGRPRVGQGRGGPGARHAARGDRPPPEPHRRSGRLAHRPADRHRRRARAGRDARARAGRPRGPGIPGAPDGRVRAARAGGPAAIRSGPRRRDHRAAAHRHRASRAPLRPGAGPLHPDRVRHVPQQPGRAGDAGGRLPARRRRRLREAGRRRPAGDRRRVRLLLRGGAAAVGARRHAPGQPLAAGTGAPRAARPADPGAVRLGQQPRRHVPRCGGRAPGPHARGSLHGRSRPVRHRHRALRRSGAAGDDVPRDGGPLPGLRRLLRAVRPAGGAGPGRGVVERAGSPRSWPAASASATPCSR